jgi:hypothetical protein
MCLYVPSTFVVIFIVEHDISQLYLIVTNLFILWFYFVLLSSFFIYGK